MDDTFLIGSAAFLSSIIVFVGSVFLLLTLILGARLAYLVTATVTLSFLLMMAAVWSYGTPLGPVGQMPEWHGIDIGEEAASLSYGPAGQYPEGPWHAPDPEIDEELAQATELESAALDYLEAQIEAGKVEGYESAGDAQVNSDGTRLIDDNGDLHGAVQLEPSESSEEPVDAEPVVAVLEFDPGNPSGPARQIAGGTLILFLIHLFFLSRAEKRTLKSRRESEEATS